MDDDPIQRLRLQWQAELPELDTAAMATVARLNQVRSQVMRQVETAMVDAGSTLAVFDVLSALRRQGFPYEMKPSSIARSIMLSASGMTNRIDQLERAGLVQRVPDPESRRTAPVALTAIGVELAERLAQEVAQAEEQMLSTLTTSERETLDELLTRLAAGIARPT